MEGVILDLLKNLPREGNVSYGLFKCGVCGKEVKRPLSNGKRAKKCGSPGCGNNYFTTQAEALAGDGLIFIEDNDDGTAKFQCPYCMFTVDRPKSKGKSQKSCGCSKWQTSPYKYWFRFKTPNAGQCSFCGGDAGGDIKPGDWVWGMRIRGRWYVVHEDCYPYAMEEGHWAIMDEIAEMKDPRQRELTYLRMEESSMAFKLGRRRP